MKLPIKKLLVFFSLNKDYQVHIKFALRAHLIWTRSSLSCEKKNYNPFHYNWTGMFFAKFKMSGPNFFTSVLIFIVDWKKSHQLVEKKSAIGN